MKQSYKDCTVPLDALILYQSNVRQILITSTDDRARIEELWNNDRDFLNWLTEDTRKLTNDMIERCENVDTCPNPEI